MNLMKKKLNKKGFTLAELLIVVAIIAVLVAIAIPVFTTQLEKAKESTDLANIRSAYAEAMIDALESDDSTGEATSQPMTQAKAGWDHVDAEVGGIDCSSVTPVKGNQVKVAIDADGNVTFSIVAGGGSGSGGSGG